MSYTAPTKDMLFAMRELPGLAQLQQLPGCADATDETVEAVLEECGKLASEVVAPLNRPGDVNPARWDNGRVTTTPGFKEAFRAFARLRQTAWEKELSPPEAASLALAWVAADRAACHGPIAEAAGALLDSVTAPAA